MQLYCNQCDQWHANGTPCQLSKGVAPRTTAPCHALGYQNNEYQAFRVWGNDPTYTEDTSPWKCLAAFQYLQEALDYIAYCQDRGSDVVFQTPADCVHVKASGCRVVSR